MKFVGRDVWLFVGLFKMVVLEEGFMLFVVCLGVGFDGFLGVE